jgi:ABC-type dipeptide/oligopeptide/nickel transport system permease subunit
MGAWTNSGNGGLLDEELMRFASIFLASPLLFLLVLLLLIYGLGRRCSTVRRTAQVLLGGFLLLTAGVPLVDALGQSWSTANDAHALAGTLRQALVSRAMICYLLSISGLAALCYLVTSRDATAPRALLWFTAPAAIGTAVIVFGLG